MTEGDHAERVIGQWNDCKNGIRPHSSLGGQTPDAARGADRPVDKMDKADALPTFVQAPRQQTSVISNSGLAARGTEPGIDHTETARLSGEAGPLQ